MLDYDPYSPEALEDPLPIYERLRDEAPCYYIEKRDCWALSRFQDVWDGFKENDCFSSRYGDIPNLVLQEPREPAVVMLSHLDYEDHRKIMKTVGASIGPRAVERIAGRMQEVCRQVVDEVAERDRFDMVHDVAWPVISHLTALICGLPEEEAKNIHRIAHTGIDGIPDHAVGVYEESSALLDGYIEKSRAQGFEGDGMIEVFGRLEQAGALHDRGNEVIAHHVLNFFLGAPAQFPKGFPHMAYRLFKNPDQRAEVVANPDLARPAFLEALRVDTSTQSMGRMVTKPIEFHGQTFEPGQAVLLLLASAQRDEREYENPEVFDIHRNPRRTLTLGIGEHMCAGRNFGPFLGETLTRALLERMPEYTIDESNLTKHRTEFMKGWVELPTHPN